MNTFCDKMLAVPKILNCSHRWCRLSNLSGYYLPKYTSHNIYPAGQAKYATFASTEKESELPDSNDTNADTFGTLRKPFKRSDTKYASDKFKVIKIKNRPNFNKSTDANVFGNLSPKNTMWYPDIKEESRVDNNKSDDSEIIRNISKKYRYPQLYVTRMKELVAEKKIKEALELFLDMKKNFVPPHEGHYTVMITACAKVGYTNMAFKLLRQMTDRKFIPSPATLTSLFNSCAESPFPEYGLRKAWALKDKIRAKNWEVTQFTCHAMIKAFGKCGDIQAAFQVVDEMAKDDIKIDVSTYSFLLMSCVADKEAGFTHAIEVWRKMKQRRCNPCIYTFNLLLRAARDCDIGPKEISCLLLQHWSSFPTRPYGFEKKESLPLKKELLQIESSGIVDILPEETAKDHHDEIKSSDDLGSGVHEDISENYLQRNKDFNSAVADVRRVPQSLLSVRPSASAEVLELGNIKTSSDRLALIGNPKGFLLDMKSNRTKPDIKTFTLLLECMPSSTQDEEELLSLMEANKVKPDTGFFNVLIKKRSFRFDHEGAANVLLLLHKWSLIPDILTYGVLALGCNTHQKAKTFVNDMRKLGLTPNTEIVGSLVSGACKAVDFDYIENALKLMEEEGLVPNEKMLLKLESTVKNIRQTIFDMEHGKDVPNVYKKEGFSRRYKVFCMRYEQWLKDIKFDEEEHVWSQYKTDIF